MAKRKVEKIDDSFGFDESDKILCDMFHAKKKPKAKLNAAKAIKRHEKILLGRANSEQKLHDMLGPIQNEMSYHVISGGDIDALSYLMYVVKHYPLDYCLFSTWCMAMPDVLQIESWLDSGRIGRVDAYVGEIFQNSYTACWVKLCEVLRRHGGRVCVFRNHSKVFAGVGDRFGFSIESSANINTNPRTENTVLTTSTKMFWFYKDFFDGIKSFDRSFDKWEKWEKISGGDYGKDARR